MASGAITRWLDRLGADVVGVAPTADWAAYFTPELQGQPLGSVLLFGAGGPEIIRRCQAYTTRHGDLEHWLSDYAQALFEAEFGGPSPRYLNPYRTGLAFPFQRLAVATGVGVLGRNNVVLNPRYGPWFSLLGAVVLEESLPPTGPDGFDPCRDCPAPCLKACPAGAVSSAGYDGMLCIETKLAYAPCLHACPARHACVVRSDLRAEMVALEGSRRRDDEETRALYRSFLQEKK